MFIVDVNNYQTKKLQEFTDSLNVSANKVRLFKQDIELSPMTSYERMIVHTTFSNDTEIKTESPLQTHIGQVISRGDRMDYMIQKSTELGATIITPLTSERCEVKLKGDREEKRVKHWQQIATSAAEQCGRSNVPVIPKCTSSAARARPRSKTRNLPRLPTARTRAPSSPASTLRRDCLPRSSASGTRARCIRRPCSQRSRFSRQISTSGNSGIFASLAYRVNPLRWPHACGTNSVALEGG